MTGLLSDPSVADLYLAFRQAKTAHFFEKRGVGLLKFAEYEEKLPDNLAALKEKVAGGAWFDRVEVGQTWIVPKRLRDAARAEHDDVVRIGVPRPVETARALDIQLRLSPHPDFATVEVLYLWRFGGLLDGLLSKSYVLGSRLDLRAQAVVPHRRWVFEYWRTRYQEFRAAPLDAARNALESGERVLIVGADLKSFYDTVQPSFLLSDQFMRELTKVGASQVDLDAFRQATMSLLDAYRRFRDEASKRTSLPVSVGVPIGPLTSRVVANVSLAPLDTHIAAQEGVLCYRRYVDDMVIVARAAEPAASSGESLRRFLPLLPGGDEVLRLDVGALARDGSEFQLQRSKVRIHHLGGVSGIDFVDAVKSGFARVVSERRAFVDSSTLLGKGVSHLIRAGEAEGRPLRVLRDADRAKLERFALSTSLQSLERVSRLVDSNDARTMVRESLELIGRVLDTEQDWVEGVDVFLRLLKLALSTGDWESANELIGRMERLWGTDDALRGSALQLYYRDQPIKVGRKAPWRWLRNYLHERRIEAAVSALPLGLDETHLAELLPSGLRAGRRLVTAKGLLRRARQLARADLRVRDREDDEAKTGERHSVDRTWFRGVLDASAELSARLDTIDRFIERCEVLDDVPWRMPAARLFLCTRPPSYFDIARRWLYRVEKNGFAPDVFGQLLEVVNAVRGTRYMDPVGYVVDRSTVSLVSPSDSGSPADCQVLPEPRLILGNLSVSEMAWKAAATRGGHPMLGWRRLQRLATVLDKATHVASGHGSALLVLPELSLPRSWLRTVANYVVRLGRFGLVAGLEYVHDPIRSHVSNQVVAVLPGPFSSVATWPWTKRLPAREEGEQLALLNPPVSFPPPPPTNVPRTVVHSPWGSLSVLICSEMIEARRIADLLGRVDVVLCPAWNKDTSSYDHLIQSAGFQLHAIIAIANNGHYSDCRAWAPRSKRWERDLCRLIERDVDDVVHVDIPLADLVAFHKTRVSSVPPARRSVAPSGWRPLPPDWP